MKPKNILKIFTIVICFAFIIIGAFIGGMYTSGSEKTISVLQNENDFLKENIKSLEKVEPERNIYHRKEIHDTPLINEIQEKENECLKTAELSYQIRECTYKADEDYDKTIQKLLSLMKKEMKPTDYKIITDSQERWEKQRKKDYKIITDFIFNHGGTVYYDIASVDYMKITFQRAYYLENLYEEYKQGGNID